MRTKPIESSNKLNPQAEKFISLFNLKYPIVEAPAAGPAGVKLAIAVAEAGAMASLPLTWTRTEQAIESVKQVKAATNGSFFVNYVLHFRPRSLDKVLEVGVPAVQFSWGMPSTEIASKVRAAGAKLGIQVTSAAGAKAALALGADYLVCQGVEAGGHVHASQPLIDTLEDVLSVASTVPVLVAGGIATGHDIRRILALGAAGVVMGTRFVATQESLAHTEYKQALLNADEKATVFTICLSKGWEHATHRILRNDTVEMWEAAGCPQPGQRPNEHEIVAYQPNGRPIERYQDLTPVKGMTGNVTALGMYSGTGVAKINDLPTAQALIERLWQEYNDDGDKLIRQISQ